MFLVSQSLQTAQDYSPDATSEHLGSDSKQESEETFSVLTILIHKLTVARSSGSFSSSRNNELCSL